MQHTRKHGKTFYIADLHLFHENLLNPRDESLMEGNMKARKEFSSIEEMHELIRKNWNAKVGYDDTVFILGDLGLYHAEEIARFIESLNGRKQLITGNHDSKNLRSCRRLREAFVGIHEYGIINDGENKVVLFHYPIEQWEGYYRGYYHVHGHTHGDSMIKTVPRRYEACVEVTGYEPMTLEELKKKQESVNSDNTAGDNIL